MICIRCNRKIKKKDNYLRITEYLKGKQTREEFYHMICFRESQTSPAKKMAMLLGARASKLLDKAEAHLG